MPPTFRFASLFSFLIFAVSCSRTENSNSVAHPDKELPKHASVDKPNGHHEQPIIHTDHAHRHPHTEHSNPHAHQPIPHNSTVNPKDAQVDDLPSVAIFEKRILPIFQSAKPSSCSECHLSGVDLKEYIRPTHQETFASLVKAGMIDVAKPDDSKILRFISRRPEKPSLVTEKVREDEFKAFRAWIRASVSDPTLLAGAGKVEPVGSSLPVEVIRHARKDRVLTSFIDNIWSEVGRCAACHSPDRNQEQVKKHGSQVSWIKLRDPQGTLDHMVEAGLIDAAEPEKSLLLAKPTMQVKHGGGQKMVVGDRSYKQFRRFIDDYAAVVNRKYTQNDQLPKQGAEVSIVTDIWLKVTDIPAKYDKMLLQADLYRSTANGWSEYRVATSDRAVFGAQNLWQHSLSLVGPRGSKWADELKSERLPPGRYLLKLYIDQSRKLQNDFTAELSDDDFVGQVEIESGWPSGYGPMTVVKFPEK
ncbi:MAG: hypothetical protein WCJ09_25845 [Planctomycetota bacterium]